MLSEVLSVISNVLLRGIACNLWGRKGFDGDLEVE